MRRFVLLVIVNVIVSVIVCNAQEVKEMQRPKLVVGIMVDQMRWDYLTRFYDSYTDGGFRRLMADGYNCNRLMINYLPALTAVGHTSVYTGSIPALTGIIGNNFPFNGKKGGASSDDSTLTVGLAKAKRGNSPHKLLANTITDELRLATNFRSKTIGVALKPRAAIFPAGHAANGAFWFDEKSLSFITSTYYMKELPQWVKDFNKNGKAQSYARIIQNRKNKDDFWDLLYPEEQYVQSCPDKHARYYDKMTNEIGMTPWGNTITADIAIAAIDGENLGNNPAGVPDFLTVSFSSTDKIGHQVGITSIWQEDVFLRLDKEIARLLKHLDEKVGKDNYIVFLSADHAGAHNPEFLKDHKIPAGSYKIYPLVQELNDSLKSHLHVTGDIVKTFDNLMVYLNNGYEENADVMTYITKFMEAKPEIAYCFPLRDIPSYIPEPIRTMARNGYCPGRSGQMEIVPVPQYVQNWDAGRKGYDGIHHGTTHAVWNPYDTHIPFIIMGKGIRHAWDNDTHYITDISATLAAILNIQMPNACIGKAINVSINPQP